MSTAVPSMGSQPAACVASMCVTAPTASARSVMAAISATSPVADCAAEKLTSAVDSSIASARSASGAVRTRMPRSWCTANGNTPDVNSISGTSTVAPSGRAAATGARSCDTVAPVATWSALSPTRCPNSSRERSTVAAHGCHGPAPTRHSSNDCCIASQAGRGGGPYEQLSRNPGRTSHNAAASYTDRGVGSAGVMQPSCRAWAAPSRLPHNKAAATPST